MALVFKGQRSHEQGYRFADKSVFIVKVIDAQLDSKSVRLRPLDALQATVSELFVQSGQELSPYVGTPPPPVNTRMYRLRSKPGSIVRERA